MIPIRTVSVLLLGGCTISGFKLPLTAALPWLISRSFKAEKEVALTITADNLIISLEQLSAALYTRLASETFDVVIAQSMMSETVPRDRRLDNARHNKLCYHLCRLVLSLEKKIFSRKMQSRIHLLTGWADSSLEDHLEKLGGCIQIIRRYNPGAKIIIITPNPPTSETKIPFSDFHSKNYLALKEFAARNDIGLVDNYVALAAFQPDQVYQYDGIHLSQLGQQVLAQNIVFSLKTAISSED